jgi:hypothetical protein
MAVTKAVQAKRAEKGLPPAPVVPVVPARPRERWATCSGCGYERRLDGWHAGATVVDHNVWRADVREMVPCAGAGELPLHVTA